MFEYIIMAKSYIETDPTIRTALMLILAYVLIIAIQIICFISLAVNVITPATKYCKINRFYKVLKRNARNKS